MLQGIKLIAKQPQGSVVFQGSWHEQSACFHPHFRFGRLFGRLIAPETDEAACKRRVQFEYAAPELCQVCLDDAMEYKLDTASEVYTFGVILLEMLDGPVDPVSHDERHEHCADIAHEPCILEVSCVCAHLKSDSLRMHRSCFSGGCCSACIT